MSNSTAVAPQGATTPARLTPDMERMDALAREAQAMAGASIVPQEYRDNPGNCLLAIDVARRTGVPVLTVTQNLYIIQGRPSWSSKFLIGAVNNCGRFTPMRFEVEGQPSQPGWKCRAVATSKEDGELLEGPWVTWEMAQAEGWVNKSGSKWKTMPDLMIRYRAAAFWARLFAPEISLGLMTSEEAIDMPAPSEARKRGLAEALDATAVEEDEPTTDGEITKLQGLMSRASDAGELGAQEAEEFELAIHDRNGPVIRDGIRELQKRTLAANAEG